jgi:hypothetical protein
MNTILKARCELALTVVSTNAESAHQLEEILFVVNLPTMEPVHAHAVLTL